MGLSSATASSFVCVALSILLGACAGRPPPPPAPPPPPQRVAAPPAAPDPPPPPPLEEDPAPDGAACARTAECGDGAHCRGPAGCGAAWACGPPRACGVEMVAYCGCDAATFYALESCPGQPYVHVGTCDPLGAALEEAPEAVEGSRVCASSDDCRRGFVCAGSEGCGTLWTCVRRRRMRPRCGRRRDTFCSCDGETFEASARCPGRPFRHRGACEAAHEAPEPRATRPAARLGLGLASPGAAVTEPSPAEPPDRERPETERPDTPPPENAPRAPERPPRAPGLADDLADPRG